MNHDPRLEKYAAAYLLFARIGFRPGVPSDGVTGALVEQPPVEPTAAEFTTWARAFAHEEAAQDYFIGCADYSDASAFAMAIEGVRAIAGGSTRLAADLLRAAADDLDRRPAGVFEPTGRPRYAPNVTVAR